MQVLAKIPFDLDSMSLMKRAHVAPDSDDAVEFERLVQAARVVARPKAAYREVFVDAKAEDAVTIEGITFTSRMLRKNLEHAERVFPYVVTCGRELDQVVSSGDDFLREFWWELIKGEVLGVGMQYLVAHLDRRYLLPQTSTMHPGSGDADVWPIQQQKELFALLGDISGQIGVELTDTCLMIPNKTVSGIRFPTETDFRSCQVCQRPICPNRAAAFDEALWSSIQHVGDHADAERECRSSENRRTYGTNCSVTRLPRVVRARRVNGSGRRWRPVGRRGCPAGTRCLLKWRSTSRHAILIGRGRWFA